MPHDTSTPHGNRVVDIVLRDAAGNLHGIEVKSGGATRSTNQVFKDRFINTFGSGTLQGEGAKAVGGKASEAKILGVTLTSTITVSVP